jgi:hypothetical protein
LKRWDQAKIGFKWALSCNLPTNIFSRKRILAAGLMAVVKGGNYWYLLNAPDKYVHYLSMCAPGKNSNA